MMIDAHQHFWHPARGDYGWMAGSPLARDVTPAMLRPELDATDVEATILVQAAPTEAETDHLLAIAGATPWVAGVVGWVPLDAPDAAQRIAARAASPKLRGVRPMLQDLDQSDWILTHARSDALDLLAERGLVFDALVRWRQIDAIATLAERHPSLSIVLDHAGKPPLGDRAAMSMWRRSIAALAERSNVACKLSGLLTELPPNAPPDLLAGCVRHLIACFGAERLIWGSDWPVLTLAGNYEGWFDLAHALVADCSAAEQRAIFGDNARRIYRIEDKE